MLTRANDSLLFQIFLIYKSSCFFSYTACGRCDLTHVFIKLLYVAVYILLLEFGKASTNYRPISIQPYFAKKMKKAMSKRMMKYIRGYVAALPSPIWLQNSSFHRHGSR